MWVVNTILNDKFIRSKITGKSENTEMNLKKKIMYQNLGNTVKAMPM